MRSVKIGIIGIGNMGFAHAQCIYNEKVTGFKLVAVCDINEKTEQTVLNTFRDVDFYTDYNELLNREDIEAVNSFSRSSRFASLIFNLFI